MYGGTGRIAESKFDEAGYIAQPPCLWGDAPGLEPMPLASGVAFTIRAITNNTYGHHGEMAWLQVLLGQLQDEVDQKEYRILSLQALIPGLASLLSTRTMPEFDERHL